MTDDHDEGCSSTRPTAVADVASGDSACWVARVCDACGALPDGPPEPTCWRCGSAADAGPTP